MLITKQGDKIICELNHLEASLITHLICKYYMIKEGNIDKINEDEMKMGASIPVRYLIEKNEEKTAKIFCEEIIDILEKD